MHIYSQQLITIQLSFSCFSYIELFASNFFDSTLKELTTV